jgi:hypothetical protein
MKNTAQIAILVVILIGISLRSNALRTVSFEEALSKKLITYTGTKNFGQKTFLLDITNRTHDSLCIQLEVGRIFLPDDPLQPQVVTRGRDIFVSARERRSFGVNTVCGNASLLAPDQGYQEFGRSIMAHPELVTILDQLVSMRLDTRAPIQQLVWMYMNNHGIERLHSGSLNDYEYSVLLDVMKDVRGSLFDPGYRVLYREPSENEELRFTGEPVRLTGLFNLEMPEPGDVTVVLVDSNNKVVRMVRYLAGLPEGAVPLQVDMDVKGISAGEYQIKGFRQNGEHVGTFDITM